MIQVKELLRQRGMTAKDLAAKIGISEGALSKSLSGNPTLERINEIASALGVEVSELFAPTNGNHGVINCPHCGKEIKLNPEK